MSPIKTEPIPETSPSLYRFSTSPGLASGSMRYHLSYPGELGESSGSPTSPYEVQRNFSSTQAYGSHPTATYHTHSISGASSYSTDTNGSYGSNHGYGSTTPNDQYQSSPRQSVYCPCRTNPATGVVYLALSQQLQNSLPPLRQYSHHVQCQLFRKVIELNDMVQWVFPVLQNMPSILLDLFHLAMVSSWMNLLAPVMVLLRASKANRTIAIPPRITNYSLPSLPRADTPLFTLVPVLQASLHKSGITLLQLDTALTFPSQQTAITIMSILMSFPKTTLRLVDFPPLSSH